MTTTGNENNINSNNKNNDISKTSSISTSKSKMKLSHNNINPQPHINELLSTAAAATGIVGDVDALLTPMPSPPHVSPSYSQSNRSETRPERNLWRLDEILQMLRLMQQVDALESLNDKNVKSEKVFRNIEILMQQKGYRKKSHTQIWTKWKFLKSTYTTSKRNGVVPKMIPYQVYEVLDEMLSGNKYGGVSEATSMTNSLDGDISNVRLSSTPKASTGRSIVNGDTAGQENAFGMEHPIFGFRLGVVKQEPMDFDYEPGNNFNTSEESATQQSVEHSQQPNNTITSEHSSSTLNIRFQTEIKLETDSETNPPKAQMSRKHLKQSQLKDAASEKPKKLATSAPVLMSLKPVLKKSTVPPLRIAPFAKEPRPDAMELLQYPPPPPPPPLALHPPRPIQLHHSIPNAGGVGGGFTGGGSARGITMIPPRPIHKSQVATTQAMSRSLHVQPLAHSHQHQPQQQQQPMHKMPTNPNMLRLKQIPMRRSMPYSLRPERLIPDLNEDSSNSPPLRHHPHPHQQQQKTSQQNQYHHSYGIFPDMPTTSQQALKSTYQQHTATTATNKRKKRLDIPWQDTGPLPPIKQQRYNDGHNERSSTTSAKLPDPPKPKPADFGNTIKDLSSSLWKMQRESLADFFKHQIELTRKDHEFQMKQDALLMEAFQEQSNCLMKVAKKLLGKDLAKIIHEEVEGEQVTTVEESATNEENHENEEEVGEATDVDQGTTSDRNSMQLQRDEEDMEDVKTSHKNALRDLAAERIMGSAAAAELLQNQLSQASVDSDDDESDDDRREIDPLMRQHDNFTADYEAAAAAINLNNNNNKNISSSSDDDDDDENDDGDDDDYEEEVVKEGKSEDDDDDSCDNVHEQRHSKNDDGERSKF